MSEEGEATLLTKGLEEEVYTGTPDGQIVGMSDRIAAALSGFLTEPDRRNVEFVTEPYRDYDELIERLMSQRCQLRRFLTELGGYTLIPGATLSLGGADFFQLSDPDNHYYCHIRDTYGTHVVTASSHLNIGVEGRESLLRAYRVIRCEAAMYLAWTAASPFLNGDVTGFHSTRWHIFPKTPKVVPFFRDYAHFVEWVEVRLADGSMRNPRHLWLSVRPNGPASPRELSRLELRICDRVSGPVDLKGMVSLLEARVDSILADETIDPLLQGDDEHWQALAADNEEAAARDSLDAEIREWRSGKTMPMRDWIAAMVDELRPVAHAHGFEDHLLPVLERLESGNTAQRWLEKIRRGETPQHILAEATAEMAEQDKEVMGAECA